MEGISVKSLYFELIQNFIILLYLADNETSWILISSLVNLILQLWKIKNASKIVKTDKFPYFSVEDKETYA
jgi:Cleft lip and palate transmembrane protein 1 (CLPTM1)